MNDNKKQLWDTALDNLNEKHTDEAAEAFGKNTQADTVDNGLIMVESDGKKRKKRRSVIFTVFIVVASILAIAGIVAITSIIIASSKYITKPHDTESSILSEVEDDKDPDIQDDTVYTPAEDFGCHTNDDGSISITRYYGSAKEIVIPKKIKGKRVTGIYTLAFYESKLTSVIIPDSVTSIGDGAFFDCDFLTSVTIPDSVTSIGDGAFFNCDFLTSVTISDSVTSIGKKAFYRCASIETITIPDGVTGIGDCAFHTCINLESVTIGSNLSSIGEDVFGNCRSLEAINVDSDNAAYTSEDGVLFNKDITSIIYYPEGKIGEHYDIPAGVRTIGDNAFRSSCLTSITVPDSVTNIGDDAFSMCYSLTSVNIPEGVTNIGKDAFWNCSSLTSIDIPESVISIGEEAFHSTSLTSVHIPNLFAIVNASAFDDDVTVTRGSVKSVIILLLCLTVVVVVTIIVIRRIRGKRMGRIIRLK